MRSGDYGSVDSSILEKYRLTCAQIWPIANIFQLNPTTTFDQSQSVADASCDNHQMEGASSLVQN